MKKAVEGWRKFYKNQCGKASKGLRVWWVVFRRGSEWVEHWGGEWEATSNQPTGRDWHGPGKTMVRRYLSLLGQTGTLLGPLLLSFPSANAKAMLAAGEARR